MVESHVPSEEEKTALLQAQCQAHEEAMVSHNYMFDPKKMPDIIFLYNILQLYVYSRVFLHCLALTLKLLTGDVNTIDYIVLLQWNQSLGEIY